jgi:hypothetical protein
MFPESSLNPPLRSVAYSTDGSHLAVGGKFGQLRVLNALTLQPLVLFKVFN